MEAHDPVWNSAQIESSRTPRSHIAIFFKQCADPPTAGVLVGDALE